MDIIYEAWAKARAEAKKARAEADEIWLKARDEADEIWWAEAANDTDPETPKPARGQSG